MKLYGYWRSSCTWRVRIALNLKGLGYTYEAVHLLKDGGQQNSDAYRAVNPLRTVPTLEFQEGGTVRRLSQSMAILEYLEERHPTPALLPAGPWERARCRMLSESVNSGIQPLQNTSVMQFVKKEFQADEKAFAAHWNARGLTALEAMVQETAGTYCIGEQVSFADLFLVPQLYGARRYGVDLTPYPTLTRIEAACEKLPAFQAAHADRQPDAVPA
ncbi:maleylacetoacetate isomerase [Stigmatella aurantiaca]|uniref:Maleylacetoacetate isomerase n=1 Tax=Stigmatella aurantiaca (strain DW4/3-1) TaxID=378806 RepID=Q08WC2_STIAD|nr:maleylacetoacetate isomerase [Stigmatella aurantiaca]ADO69265.1 Maleylacetoacetate isomerase [Stigmatella aurantiaca DW4/3-1]EAU64785.1 maleylacetoacetate isomerase [Stigmatella aurantiaca DW4/3-1]